MGVFDVFKDKDDEDDKGVATEEEIKFESFKDQDSSSGIKQEPEQETPSYSPTTEETQSYSSSQTSQIGIEALMDKRVKLEEAIDYVGLMIKNLKDKRTKLVKNIEDESVDIRNLKEKLTKIDLLSERLDLIILTFRPNQLM